MELNYSPQPKQKLLHFLNCQQILYGGSAGGGKSHAMRWDAVMACLTNPGCDAYLFRKTRTDLEHTHVKRVRNELKELEPHVTYNITRNRVEFWNGSYLNMCYAEHADDVYKYDSVEFHWLGIDEAGHFTPEQLAYLRTRLRIGSWVPKQEGRFPRFIMSANPGGVSHHYLKTNFMTGRAQLTVMVGDTEIRFNRFKDEDGWDTAFIPASMRDNSYLDENYARAFSKLPQWKQKQLVDGDWDVIPGAFFDCWDPHNIIRPFELPHWWTKFRAIDWGFSQPFWIGEFVISDGTPIVDSSNQEVTYPEGTVICCWEWYGGNYGRANKGLRRDAADIAQEVVRRRGTCNYTVGGYDMFKVDQGPSPAEKFSIAGMPISKAEMSQGRRKPGWQHMYSMIESKQFLSFDTNMALNACIPSLEADPDDPDDVLKAGEDHPGDGCRYGLMSRPSVKHAPPPKKPLIAPPTWNQIIKAQPTKHSRVRLWQ